VDARIADVMYIRLCSKNHQLLQDIRARDSTINEIEEKLQETAEAVETAASAARSIDEERRFFTSELERFA